MKAQGVEEDRLELLKGVSGSFRPGVLTALMVVSGAGKTTLMDVLSRRKTGGYVEGRITISGYPKKQETFACISGYCEQNDIHSPNVTVYESLLYSTWFRLPSDVNSNTRKVERVVGHEFFFFFLFLSLGRCSARRLWRSWSWHSREELSLGCPALMASLRSRGKGWLSPSSSSPTLPLFSWTNHLWSWCSSSGHCYENGEEHRWHRENRCLHHSPTQHWHFWSLWRGKVGFFSNNSDNSTMCSCSNRSLAALFDEARRRRDLRGYSGSSFMRAHQVLWGNFSTLSNAFLPWRYFWR